MSDSQLKKAARIPLGPKMDFEGKLVLMLLADRADDTGRYSPDDENKMADEIAAEMRAILKRLRGEFAVIPGADAFRVTRVVEALEDADLHKPPTIQ